MSTIEERIKMIADLIDAVIGIDSSVGTKTPDWPYSDGFALQRMRLGASLTILTSGQGEVVRYTIHHIGAPFKITPALGKRLVAELPLRECWSVDSLGRIDLKGGKLTLYQVDDTEADAADASDVPNAAAADSRTTLPDDETVTRVRDGGGDA